MQDDSGMSDYSLLASCRCQAVSRMMKTDVVCVVLMEVPKCPDARETVLPVWRTISGRWFCEEKKVCGVGRSGLHTEGKREIKKKSGF